MASLTIKWQKQSLKPSYFQFAQYLPQKHSVSHFEDSGGFGNRTKAQTAVPTLALFSSMPIWGLLYLTLPESTTLMLDVGP